MASYNVLIDSEPEFAKNSHSPAKGMSGLIIHLDEKPVNDSANFVEGEDDAFAEGLFSLDEDMEPGKNTGGKSKSCSAFGHSTDVEEEESDDSGNFEISRTHSSANNIFTLRQRLNVISVEHLDRNNGQVPAINNSVPFGTSLPITIPAGRFWPPKDALDSVNKESFLNSDEEEFDGHARTVLPQRPPKNLYNEMRAQARSIQAVDDPERLFGERPQRRRYQTGQNSVRAAQVKLPQHENAVVIVAANVSELT